MPRRARVQKRVILPDPIYGSVGLAKFVNCIMLAGKKSIAEKIVYELVREDPAAPRARSRSTSSTRRSATSRRSSRSSRSVSAAPPTRCPSRSATTAARRWRVRWIIRYARGRGGKSMSEKLAGELMDAANGVGASIKRKEDTHKMAESNKAFSHFRY